MSIKFELFTCKEHYLAFRKAFANAVNNERAKSHLEPGYDNTKYRVKGWIQAEHFVLLNLLRDKPIQSGFTIIKTPRRLMNGNEPHCGFRFNVDYLKDMCCKHKEGSWYWEKQQKFLEPFQGTIDLEMLYKLHDHIPEVKDLYMWRSDDAKLIAKLIDDEITSEDFWKEVIHVD